MGLILGLVGSDARAPQVSNHEGANSKVVAPPTPPVAVLGSRNGVKVLLVASNPMSTQRLDLEEEIRLIEHRVRASSNRAAFEFRACLAARPDDLLQVLNEEAPSIVHFSGHGGGNKGLLFRGDDGSPRFIAANALKRLFSSLGNSVRLVFFNACYSETQGQSVAEIVDCVVGMSDAINDRAAVVFSGAFYRALGFGKSVKEAVEQGRTAIELENLAGVDIPILLTKKGIDPSLARVLPVASSEYTENNTHRHNPKIAIGAGSLIGGNIIGGDMITIKNAYTEELIALLEHRAEEVEKDFRYPSMRRSRRIMMIASEYRDLHRRHIAALSAGNLVVAHEIHKLICKLDEQLKVAARQDNVKSGVKDLSFLSSSSGMDMDDEFERDVCISSIADAISMQSITDTTESDNRNSHETYYLHLLERLRSKS